MGYMLLECQFINYFCFIKTLNVLNSLISSLMVNYSCLVVACPRWDKCMNEC